MVGMGLGDAPHEGQEQDQESAAWSSPFSHNDEMFILISCKVGLYKSGAEYSQMTLLTRSTLYLISKLKLIPHITPPDS